MTNMPRLTESSLKVLSFMLSDVSTAVSGYDILKATGIASGTLYPILARFDKARLVESNWEDIEPSAIGRPRRRYYRLTAAGVELSESALNGIQKPRKSNRGGLSNAI